jgi:hypothetical protein
MRFVCIWSELNLPRFRVYPRFTEGFGRANMEDFQKSNPMPLANDCIIYVLEVIDWNSGHARNMWIVNWIIFISPSMRMQELYFKMNYIFLHQDPFSLLMIICPPHSMLCNIYGLVGAVLLNWKNIVCLNTCAHKHTRTLVEAGF